MKDYLDWDGLYIASLWVAFVDYPIPIAYLARGPNPKSQRWWQHICMN